MLGKQCRTNHESQVITSYNQLLFKKGLIGPKIPSTGAYSSTSKFDFGLGINRLKSTCDGHVICPLKDKVQDLMEQGVRFCLLMNGSPV